MIWCSCNILINLSDKTLERSLANEEIGRLLVPADLLESDGVKAVAVERLHSSSGRCSHLCTLNGNLFAGGLSSCRLLGCLPDPCHVDDG